MKPVPVSWELRDPLVVLTVSGSYSFSEGQGAMDEVLAHPEFRKGMSLLIDARLSLANPSAEEIQARAEWLASLTKRGLSLRMAVVTGPELFRYGLTRMLSAYAEHRGIEIATVASVEEAECWLVGPEGSAPD